MRKSGIFLRMLLMTGCLLFLVNSFMVEVSVAAGTVPEPETAAVTKPEAAAGDEIKEEELAQLLAPIALYPDTLLMQMFMASTYPLEVVEAARFVKENSKLKEDALDKALESKDWDDSVKSICHFPSVLKSMDEHLEATKKLGDFFLADQKAVMDMVQTLRAKAKEQGELKSTKEQKVIEKVVEKEKIIIIEPTDPQVVYVPTYSSTVVYGSWWYPTYPPYVWYPPPPAYGFVAGVAVGAWASHHWCHANWHRGDIDVNINRNINVNRPGGGSPRTRPANGRQGWKHNPKHRKGVSYRNRDVRKRYGQSDRRARQRDMSRGYGNKGLDRKTRDQIKREGLKSNNGKFGQNTNRKTRPTNASARTRQNRADNSANRSRQSRNTNKSTTNRTSRTRNRNRATTNRASQTRSRSSFNRSGSARQVNRNSARGRPSRSFSSSRRGGGMRGGGRRR